MNEFTNFLIDTFNNKSLINDDNIDEILKSALNKSFPSSVCNLESFKYINYGLVTDTFGPDIYGLKIKNKNILLSQIVYLLEELLSNNVPSEILEELPNITKQEWKSSLRVIMLFFSSFETVSTKLDQENRQTS